MNWAELSEKAYDTHLISYHWRRKTVGEPAGGRAGSPGGRTRSHLSCSLSWEKKISILKNLASPKIKSRAKRICKWTELSSLLKERRPAGHKPRLSGEPQQSHQDEENAGDHLWVAETQNPQRAHERRLHERPGWKFHQDSYCEKKSQFLGQHFRSPNGPQLGVLLLDPSLRQHLPPRLALLAERARFPEAAARTVERSAARRTQRTVLGCLSDSLTCSPERGSAATARWAPAWWWRWGSWRWTTCRSWSPWR